MDKETQLAELRREIDGIDAKIVELVDQRADVVRRVGELKGATGTAVFRPERENLILERAASLSRNFDGPAVKAIFREIISSCRALERTTTVAYLGPAGTFSEMAVLRQFWICFSIHLSPLRATCRFRSSITSSPEAAICQK